jgi:protein-tyrosine phosphatase
MTGILDDLLYLGNINNANPKFLREHNIKCIINVAHECTYTIPEMPDLVIYKYDIIDKPIDVHQYFDEIIDIINKYRSIGSLLIHCMAGISRSPAFVIAYLMKTRTLSLFEAYNYVRKLRNIMPNPHFMSELMIFEQTLMHTNSFEFLFDEYSIKYIMVSLGQYSVSYDDVSEHYLKNGKNYELTKNELRKITDLREFRDFFNINSDEIIDE